MSGLIAMISVLVVVGIEMFFAIKGAGHSHSVDLEYLRGDGPSFEERDRGQRSEQRRSGSFKPFRQGPIGMRRDSEDDVPLHLRRSPYSDNPGSLDKPLPPPPQHEGDESEAYDLDLDELEDDDQTDSTHLLNSTSETQRKPTPTSNGHAPTRPNPPSRNVSFADPLTSAIPPSPSASNNVNEQRLILQCLLLEAGILFHSVFIGMALSVSTGPAFVVLLIAISFHQTFEGLALGSRIAAIPSFSTTSLKPWAMSVMYGVTTPIGQAIGLAVHTLYDPASQFGLLMVGIVNAISSGLLLYAGLVQLLSEDFLSDQSYVDLKGKRRLQACVAVIGGSMLMGECQSSPMQWNMSLLTSSQHLSALGLSRVSVFVYLTI
jgi:zinc transporter ZupT